jgi:hypothetical protein
MSDQPEVHESDVIQRELRALLAEVEPSPAFAAGVRARIAADDAKRGRAWLWWAMPAAAVLMVGVATWPLVSRRVVPSRPSAADRVAAVVPTPVVVPAPGPSPVPAPHAVAREPQIVPQPAAHGFEVLVPDDQMTALVHYLDGLNRGVVPASGASGPQYDADGVLVPPAPLVITPLPALGEPPDEDKNAKPDGKGAGKDKR